jgi:hypothetical protein
MLELYRHLEKLTASIIREMIEAAAISETSVNFYRSTHRSNREDILKPVAVKTSDVS